MSLTLSRRRPILILRRRVRPGQPRRRCLSRSVYHPQNRRTYQLRMSPSECLQPLSSFALQQLSAISRVADHSAVPAERPALPTQQPAAPIALIPKANGSARRSSALQLRWGLRQYIPRRGRVTESASTRRLALSSPPFAAPRPSAIGREYEPADRP